MTAALPGKTAPMASPDEVDDGSAVVVLCERGYVYSRTRHLCVDLSSNTLSDEELYAQGRALALAAHYHRAIDVLTKMRNPDDPRILTMLGFAKRKTGQLEESITAYRRALALAPDNLDARNYLGEAYAQAGQMDLARAELQQIETICGGRTCEQYIDLAELIMDITHSTQN